MTELHDHSETLLLREMDLKPRIKMTDVYHPYVLEVIRVVIGEVSWSTSFPEQKRALETGKPGAPIVRIYSSLLLAALHEISTYWPQTDQLSAVSLPYPFASLVHHRKELEDLKAKNQSNLSSDELSERNRHIDCALKVVQAEHGQELTKEEARLAQTTLMTTFASYWIHLKPGTMVYKFQHGILSPCVIGAVTGGTVNDKLEQ